MSRSVWAWLLLYASRGGCSGPAPRCSAVSHGLHQPSVQVDTAIVASQAGLLAIELVLGVRYAKRFVTVCLQQRPGGLGCCTVALSGEVHDGRGAELLRGYGPGSARGPAVRSCGPCHREGRGGQKPSEVGQLLRLLGGLHGVSEGGRADAAGPDHSS